MDAINNDPEASDLVLADVTGTVDTEVSEDTTTLTAGERIEIDTNWSEDVFEQTLDVTLDQGPGPVDATGSITSLNVATLFWDDVDLDPADPADVLFIGEGSFRDEAFNENSEREGEIQDF